MGGKLQNADFKSEAELIALGATKTELLNTTKMYSPKTTNVLETDLRKNNDAASVAPTTSNDSSQGYEPGSRWIDTVAQKTYFCISNGVGAALWKESGSGGGIGGVDIFHTETAESVSLTDFTQTGLEIVSSPIILHGLKSFRLIHQAASTRDFKRILPVDSKFRGKNWTMELDAVSSALSANLTLLVRDETNNADLAVSQQIATDSQQITATVTNASNQLTGLSLTDFNLLKLGMLITGTGIPTGTRIDGLASATLTATLSQNATSTSTSTKRISSLTTKRKFTFDVPTGCLSFSYKISALQEAGLPESYIDDIVIQLTQYAQQTASITVPKAVLNDISGVISSAGVASGPITSFIQSITKNAVGDYTVNFITGAYTAAPSVRLTPMLTGGPTGFVSIVNAVTTSSFRYRSNQADAGGTTHTLTDMEVHVEVSKQGADYVNPLTSTESKTISLTTAQLVQQPDSYLRMNNFNTSLRGSTGTKIARFDTATFQESSGDAIQYIADAVNGDRFVALKDGLFRIGGELENSGGAGGLVVTKNASSLTSTLTTIPASEVICRSYDTGASGGAVFFGEANLKVGDIVRVHADTFTSDANWAHLTVSYQGSLKQLNPSSNSLITIPTHQLRFEGSSARGSTDTAIVKFDSQTITSGDAFDVVNTAANGTVITMKKAGKLSVGVGAALTAAGSLYISKNQSVLTTDPTSSEVIAKDTVSSGGFSGGSSATIDVVIGDKIRVCSNSAITASTNFLSLSLTESSIPANFSNVLPQWSQSDSSIRLNTGNGFGSTNTQIRRFSNNPDNLGTALSYTDSASLGASVTVNEDGVYNVAYSDLMSVATNIYILKNTTTAGVSSNMLGVASGAAGQYVNASASGVHLLKGDVVRVGSDGPGNISSASTAAQFTISKVGKPNLTSVDVTPFVNTKTTDTEAIEALTATSTWGSTNTGVPVLNITRNTNLGVIQVISDSVNGTSFKALKDCNFSINSSVYGSSAGGGSTYITKNSTQLLAAGSIDGKVAMSTTSGIGYLYNISASVSLKANDTVRIQRDATNITNINQVTITAIADNNATASPTQQVSSDTMNFVFKATAIDPAVDPIGTFNTYTYAINTTNTLTISGAAPTQSASSMNNNGIQVFSRVYGAASTAAQPARIDVFIGKGLKSKQIDAYSATGKSGIAHYDKFLFSTTTQFGTMVVYNETTGILTFDAGEVYTTTIAARGSSIDAVTGSGISGTYFVFNASKSPSLVTIPNLTQRVAYLSDVKASGTSGGTAGAATTQTRTLNTIVDPTGVVTSLASNQFTLPAGTYKIDATAPALIVNSHRARIRNITDGVTSLLGKTAHSNGTNGSQTDSIVSGEITITSAKVFELQHYTLTARATDGLGTAASSGENEVYAQVTITKIK